MTHFLTITPSRIPPLPPSPPSPTPSPVSRPHVRPQLPATLSMTPTYPATFSDSAISSPASSRSSSFSGGSGLSSLSPRSSAGTSVHSLLAANVRSKLRQEAPSSDSDDGEDDVEPTFLAVAGVQHYHLPVTGPASVDMLVKLHEAASFIQRSLRSDAHNTQGFETDRALSLPPPFVTDKINKHLLIHCTTESRGVLVACAYLMQARGLRPSQAYSIVEKGPRQHLTLFD